MKVKIHKFIIDKLVESWPIDRSYWQDAISDIIKVQVIIPQFFWQIEVIFKSDLELREIEIVVTEVDNWLSIKYKPNFCSDFESYVNQQLISSFSDDLLLAS